MKHIEEIERRIKRNFKITSCDVDTIKEFKKFCQENCGDVYAIGLKRLLEIKEDYKTILPLLSNLQEQINDLKTAQSNTQLNKRRTFG